MIDALHAGDLNWMGIALLCALVALSRRRRSTSPRSGVALVDGKGHQARKGSGLQELRTGAGKLQPTT